MSSNVTLYGHEFSPPVRATRLLLKALGIPFEFKVVNLMAGEQMSAEFTKHNPQHTVPVVDDNGTWIWDSHAICAYLVDKYGKDDSLYPKDLAKRAVVNQRLYFEAGILYMALRNITLPLFKKNITVVYKEKTDNIVEGYDLVETFLADNQFITGDTLTIADFSIVSTVSSLREIVEIKAEKYPKTLAWLERMAELPYYEEANGRGNRQYVGFLKSAITEIVV